MDPSALLDQNLPFDSLKLQLLENVVNVFYTTKNSNERTQADKLLNEFKNLPDSWTHCATILTSSNSMYTKFLAVGILEDLIKTKWNLIQNDQRLGVRNFLVELLINNVTNEQTLTQNHGLIGKLNYTIVQIAKFEWTTTWTSFMTEICESGKSNPNLCENNLKLLQMLSEEISMFWKNSMTSNKMQELKNMMAKEFSSVFDLCMFIFQVFETQKDVKKSLLKAGIRVYADYIKWFPIEYTFKEEILLKFISFLKEFPAVRLDVMKCFGEIFTINFEHLRQSDSEQYFKIKNMTLQLFKAYVLQMYETTNKSSLAVEYERIKMDQRGNFEEFCLQFALSIIAYFKNNFSFMEDFDFIEGSQMPNDFCRSYLEDFQRALEYICQINHIPNDEIFKVCCEFWNWLCFKVCFLREKDADPGDGIPISVYEHSLNNYVAFTHETFYYKNLYFRILETVRQILISKMTKPIEVKMELDESGEICCEQIGGTINQTLNETMKDSLIYLTHLDPISTEKFMIDTLQKQMDDSSVWNPYLLNSLCWSIGSIAGAMEESHEKKFVVLVIKYLLNLCEKKKGKTNKAIVAANIMYVVGQYPRFLNSHWKFLKTVIKKLFEFMHETHPGVQDFACETFLKIAIKCGDETIKLNEGENEPYINCLVRTIKDDTADLAHHQKLMFYEAVATMIKKDPDMKRQQYYVQQMMQSIYNDWSQIFESAQTNSDILQNNMAIKALDVILKLNERIAIAVGDAYYSFGTHILDNVLKAYIYYSTGVNNAYTIKTEFSPLIKTFRVIKKTILKYIQALVKSIDDKGIILTQILPQLAVLIEQYRYGHIDNRDADVLLVFAEVLNKIKNTQYDYINNIWQYLCLFTLDMIKSDFQSYPEHRIYFFTLIKSLITNAFDALFQIQESNFNTDVINAIVWAFRHDQPAIAETGLETLIALITNIKQIKISNGINVADPFFKTFYFTLAEEILCVLTDSFHKSGFNLQVEILNELILILEDNLLAEHLFSELTNKQHVINYLNNILAGAFSHLNKIQIESVVLTLFNRCYKKHEFKNAIRDLLISLKTFSGENDELYEEEKRIQIEEAKQIEERKRSCVPGLIPVYDQRINQNISSINYVNNSSML